MEQGYTIGAIAKMTGIPTQTLRSWERRYGVTAPQRSPSGRRLYSDAELEKLRAIKQLLARGEAISQVAGLDLEALQARLLVHGGTREHARGGERRQEVHVCGATLAGALRKVRLPERVVLGECRESLAECEQLAGVLLIELEALRAGQLEQLGELRKRARAARVVLVVGFASSAILARAGQAGFEVLPQRFMLAAPALALETLLLGGDASRTPPRRFSDSRLAAVLRSTPELVCECPHHVVGILKQLNAFETYSQGCMADNENDAATHALLHRVTARARAQFEDVLDYLVELDGIDIEPAAGRPETQVR